MGIMVSENIFLSVSPLMEANDSCGMASLDTSSMDVGMTVFSHSNSVGAEYARDQIQQGKFNNLYPPTKGYLRETCKSQNINPIYLTLSSPTVSFRS